MYDVLEFGRYDLQIREQQAEQRRRKLSVYQPSELLQQPGAEARAEWHWRLAIPLSIPILMLLAVPLSRVNPRQGKFGRLLPAFSLFLGYYILLIISRSLLEDGKLPLVMGMWWIHALAAMLAAALFLQHRAGAQRLKARLFGRGEHA